MKRICWFRSDFRLDDQHMLARVVEDMVDGDEVEFVFWLNPAYTETFDLRHDYFFTTMRQFMERLETLGMGLRVIVGEQSDFLSGISGVDALYFNAEYVSPFKQRDDAVIAALDRNVRVVRVRDRHLFSLQASLKADGSPYRVFTPFKKRLLQQTAPSPFVVDVERLRSAVVSRNTYPEELVRQFESCRMHWTEVGEEAAKRRLREFVSGHLADYHEARDVPSIDGTSRLSPYLRTGALNVRTIVAEMRAAETGEGMDRYYDELLWREFYYMVLSHNDDLKERPFDKKYEAVRWNEDEESFLAWCEGRTGYPIVDAAMRQLNETGWMHNRLRMVTASFLTKHLLTDWRKGERYFERKLIDYEPASNIGGWQWAASVGTDAVPYFRIFNPTLQSKRFDPEGVFLRSYLPELSHVPLRDLHAPSRERRGNYPAAIVDHAMARERALQAFRSL